MSRFNTPEQVKAWAAKAVVGDYEMSVKHNSSLNPFCTDGARNDWQRGFDNAPPRSYELTQDFDTIYQRGRAMAELLNKIKEQK